jgi:RNA polymerase sigma-70 factor (ECF subfamily)
LVAARTGSKEALGAIFELCRPYLLAIANREFDRDFQGKAGASDLVQESFIEAQQAFPRFIGESMHDVLAWLRTILSHNLRDFRDYCSAQKRRASLELCVEEDCDGMYEQQYPGSSPSSQAIQHEEQQALTRALGRLPDHYRQVIAWHFEQGRSYGDIGAELGVSAEAARLLCRRAVAFLTRELNDE